MSPTRTLQSTLIARSSIRIESASDIPLRTLTSSPWHPTWTAAQSSAGRMTPTAQTMSESWRATGKWNGWLADDRVNAQSDLYQSGVSCSAWRSLQGWLSLSRTNTGEGTLRLLPSLKASMAYIMLQPLFHTGEFNSTLPTFPGSTPGKTQFFPTIEHHPHLDINRTLISIPPVRPSDYILWHYDLIHSVNQIHRGVHDSSVFYNACNPLTSYNIKSLAGTHEAFLNGDIPADFCRYSTNNEKEYQHEDYGAKKENILSNEALKALGLMRLDEEEDGLTKGQRAIRRLANAKLGL